MKKLTTSVLAVVLASSFVSLSAQNTQRDTIKETKLGEVVITGALGIKKRADAVTSANQVISSEELQQAKNPNAVQALTGKVSGLQINTTNSSVNPEVRVVLRGPRSISGNNQALVVIDGVISTMAIYQNLPPEIVESTNVIKGQQGAALYGERGSNGVIIVTTKRGSRSEKMTVNMSNSVEFTTIYKTPLVQKIYGQGIPGDSFDETDYGGTTFTPYENTSWGPRFDSSIGGTLMPVGMPQANNNFIYQTYSPLDNHFSKFFKVGSLFQNGLSVNMGGPDGYVFFSANRAENNFVVEEDQLKRNNFIFKAGKKFGKLRVDGNVNFLDVKTSVTDSGLYDDLIQTPSNVDVRAFRNSSPDASYTIYAINPYWTIRNARANTSSRTFTGLVNLQYDLNDHVNFTYSGTIAQTSVNRESYRNGFLMNRVYTGTGTPIDNHGPGDYGKEDIRSYYYKSSQDRFRYYGDLMANFDYDLSDNLNLKLNLGHNIQDDAYTTNEVGGYGLEVPGWYNINNVQQLDKFSTLNNGKTRIRSFAWFANLDLDFSRYLFLNATFRYEKSSVLSIRDTPTEIGMMNPVRNEGYPYYSVGLSFVPTKAWEGMKGDVLNYMKLSVAHTRVGNSYLGAYQVDEIGVIPTGYPFGSLSAYTPALNRVSQDIKPEFTFTNEGNVQFGFFKDRVTLEGSVYETKTDGLITARQVSSASGITSLTDNIGDMKNRGFEIDLGITPIKTKDFEWKLRGAYSTYKSIVNSLDGGTDEITLLSTTTPSAGIFAVVGENMPVIKGTKYQRDPNGNIIVGANGNPLATSTMEILGKVNPDYILEFNTSIKIKSFTLSGTADYRTGNSFLSLTKSLLGFTGGLQKSASFDRSQGYIIPGSVRNTGTAANPVYVANTTPVGSTSTAPGNNYNAVTSYFTGAYRSIGEEFVIDGTAFKIRELSLTYHVPKSVYEGTFLNSLSAGVYARNPFIWYAKSNENFADPESASNSGNAGGISTTGQYPTVRTFGFNLNATF